MESKQPKKHKSKVSPRKVSYSPEVFAAITRAAEAGASDVEIIKVVGCNPRTFYRWREVHPEINEVLSRAQAKAIDYAALEHLEERRRLVDEWIDDYLRNRGEITETCDGDGLGSYTKTKKGLPPDMRLLASFLGERVNEKFEVTISVAQPEHDDDDEFDDDDDEDIGEI